MQERSDFGATGETSYTEPDYFSPDEEHEATRPGDDGAVLTVRS